jgi:2-polyprenyl-3-methyl-5-hydroxy-6-metoxy-1,4-benzoquinol methylase
MDNVELIREWTRQNRGAAEPLHQCERYAWLKENASGSVLSIGCGEAKVEEYLYIKDDLTCDHTVPVCGADFNNSFLESARKRWPNGTFVNYDICNSVLAFKDNTFDTVILGDVIEHVPPYYLHKLLSDSLRVCRPQGKILITTPNGSYFGDNNSSSIYSNDHVIVMTTEVLFNILLPTEESKRWWIIDGKAEHNFNYTLSTKNSLSQRFIFVRMINTKEMKNGD